MIEDAAAAVSRRDAGAPRRGSSERDEPVELLVQLADDGEIDPWDIDIVSVTDAYLSKLEEVDLRVSGRALFYASVLLRMKSEVLIDPEDQETQPEQPPGPMTPDGWADMGPGDVAAGGGVDPIDSLEQEMDRRLDRKRARGTPDTLDELVRELRDIERRRWWKPHREYDTSESPSGFDRGTQTIQYHTDDADRMADEPTAEEVTGATHSEDIDELIDTVWEALHTQFDAGRAEVLFAEVATSTETRVQAFLGVLFLSDRGRIRLEQDDLFGDLWIMPAGNIAAME